MLKSNNTIFYLFISAFISTVRRHTPWSRRSIVMDPMNVGSRIVNFVVNLGGGGGTAQSSHNSEIYNIGVHAQ